MPVINDSAGKDDDDFPKVVDLTVDSTIVSQRARVTVTFSREIFNPWLLYHPSHASDSEESSTKEPSRNLHDFDVTDTFLIEVKDAELFPDLEKGLMSYRLVEIEGETTDKLEFDLQFKNPSDISDDILSPDELNFSFLMGDIILAVKDFGQLKKLDYSFQLPRQLTAEYFE